MTSVAVGHYYQGRHGRLFLNRLRHVGLVPTAGWEDDAAFAHGVGFTDIVKRPTRQAKEITAQEFSFGRLLDKLEGLDPALVLFTYKQAAVKVLGPFDSCGFVASPASPTRIPV